MAVAQALAAVAVGSCLAGPAPVLAGGASDERLVEPPPSLPESINSVVRPGPGALPERIDRIRDVVRAIRACWRVPAGSGYSGEEITLRLAFKRSGEVLGEPRITYYKAGTEPGRREAFLRSVREALAACTPLPFTPAFGAAIAGRPFTFRFSDTRPL